MPKFIRVALTMAILKILVLELIHLLQFKFLLMGEGLTVITVYLSHFLPILC